MKIEIPELCLIATVGASGSGKSSFAKKHFKATEVLSSDYFRGLVSDDESDQSATEAAFDSLYYIASKRLERGRLTVIDATSVQQFARKKIIDIARSHDVLPVAIVFDMPEDLCGELIDVPAKREYYAPIKPLNHNAVITANDCNVFAVLALENESVDPRL